MPPNERTPLLRTLQQPIGSDDVVQVSMSSIPGAARLAVAAASPCVQTNAFLIKVTLAIGLAKVYPPLGAIYLHPEITSTWVAVMLIFGLAGLSLQTAQFSQAASRLWFNGFVLCFNFGVVSLLVFGMTVVIRHYDFLPKGLTDGMMVCACMPISITMVIVLTKAAHGDEAAAVLLAAGASMLGVLLTPALLLLYIGVETDVSYPHVFLNLFLQMALPLMIGQVLRMKCPPLMDVVHQHKVLFKEVQEGALIFIIYTVFCKTFLKPVEATVLDILWMALFQGTALLASMLLAWYTLKCCFRDQPKLRVMGLYGCTQKSVAVGIPIIGALYANDPQAGLYTLPLLIWHPFQLLVGSALTPYLAAGVERLEGYLLQVGGSQGLAQRHSFFSNNCEDDSLQDGISVAFATPSQISWPMTGTSTSTIPVVSDT